jgi:hypothetical protein
MFRTQLNWDFSAFAILDNCFHSSLAQRDLRIPNSAGGGPMSLKFKNNTQVWFGLELIGSFFPRCFPTKFPAAAASAAAASATF